MDTEAQQAERDRSSRPDTTEDTSGTPGPEGRSRSALGRGVAWLPGGRVTLPLTPRLVVLPAPSTLGPAPFRPEGRLFVLGDHRSASSDSRDRLGSPGGGMIPAGDLIGRADGIVWPFGRAGRLHRPDAYTRVPAPAAGPAPTGGGAHG